MISSLFSICNYIDIIILSILPLVKFIVACGGAGGVVDGGVAVGGADGVAVGGAFGLGLAGSCLGVCFFHTLYAFLS
jgi:hypothetical protein